MATRYEKEHAWSGPLLLGAGLLALLWVGAPVAAQEGEAEAGVESGSDADADAVADADGGADADAVADADADAVADADGGADGDAEPDADAVAVGNTELTPEVAALRDQAENGKRPIVRLALSGGVGGGLAAPRCQGTGGLAVSDFARVASHLPEAAADGRLVIDVGGLLAQHGVAQFAARRHPEVLAELVRDLGYRALALGEADLADPSALLLSRARALNDAGVPYLASNLWCDDDASDLCDVVTSGEDGVPLFEVDAHRMALLSFLDPELTHRIATDRRRGLRVAEIEEVLPNAVRSARAAGADVVVAIVDLGYGAEAATRALSLVAELPTEAKPDIIVAANAGNEVLFARPPSFRPAFVSPPPGGVATVNVTRHQRGFFELLVRPQTPTPHPATALSTFVGRVGQSYCEEYGEPFAGGQLDADRALDAEGLVDLTSAVMRQRARADVALLNESAVDSGWHPEIPDRLTPSDIRLGIQFDEPLVVAQVSAYWLRSLARSDVGARQLRALGLDITGAFGALEKIKVNRRLLDLSAQYRIVTIRFLAEGGDDETVPAGVEWEPLGITLREAMTEYLEEDRADDPRDTTIDPWDRFEWSGTVNTGLNFAGSAVRDPAAYAEGPLTNEQQTQFGFSGSFALNATSRVAAWENTLDMNYTLAATSGTDGFDEGVDTIAYRTSGLYRGFRSDHDELYVPDLLVEGLLRTEFSTDDERDYHFVNVRFTGGLQWRLHLKVRVKLVGGAELIEAADPNARAFEPGLGVQLDIQPWLLMRTGMRKLTLTTNLDYFVSGLGGRNRHLLQGTFDFNLQLNRVFAITLDVTLYGLAEREDPFGFALQSTAGVALNWTGRRIMF